MKDEHRLAQQAELIRDFAAAGALSPENLDDLTLEVLTKAGWSEEEARKEIEDFKAQ